MRFARVSGILFGAVALGVFSANPDGVRLAGACTPVVQEVSLYPIPGGVAPPLNTGIVLKSYSLAVNGNTVSVTANAAPVAGTFTGLSESFALAPDWLSFQPAAPFAAATTVTVVVSSASGLAVAESFDFTVGSAADTTPPTGGEIVSYETFEGTSAGATPAWGWSVAFGAVSDAEGPAFIRVTVAGESPFLIEGSESIGADANGITCAESVDEGATITVSAVPIDLAGNAGTTEELEFQVEGSKKKDSGFCSVATGRGRPLSLVPLLLAAALVIARRRPRIWTLRA